MIRFATMLLGIGLAGMTAAGPLWGAAYECHMDQNATNGDLIPEVVALDISGDKATVSDPLILYFKGKPIAAKVVADSDKRLTVSWQLQVKNSENQYADFDYDLTIRKNGLTAKITGRPLAYDNSFAAQGSCTKVKD